MTTPAPMTPEQRAALMALADRVEALTGPCQRLDALICIALDPDRQVIVGQKPGRFPQEPVHGSVSLLIQMAETSQDPRDIANYICAPHYTASLDAAMTLVPEGWVFTVGHWVASDHLPAYFADCADIASVKAHDGYDAIQGRAATPALALVAAALRAKAAS